FETKPCSARGSIMSLYITCPRCHASLKANKLPSHTKTVTCPECGQVFQVSTTGITANAPTPRLASESAEETPFAPVVAAPAGRWLPIAAIASILLVGGGIIAAIIYPRTPAPIGAPTAP